MVDAGNLIIKGSLDTSDIERGQRKIEVGLDNIKSKGDSTNSTFKDISSETGKLVGLFSNIATIGVGALTGLELAAPQTAGAMAGIRATTKQLSFIIGEELAPSFDSAAESYSDFVSFLDSGSPLGELTKDVGFLAGTTGVALLGSKLLGLPKSLTIGIALLVSAEKIEEAITGFTGSETAGEVGGLAAAGTGGGLVGAAVGSLVGLGPIGAGIGALIAGTPRAFELGGNIAARLFGDGNTTSSDEKDMILQQLGDIISGKKSFAEVRESNLRNNAQRSAFNDVDTIGGN